MIEKKPTKTKNFRIPIEILDRIQILADKQHWSMNRWVVITLDRESKERTK
jgi:predicted HicB family RNase H-like nuclease